MNSNYRSSINFKIVQDTVHLCQAFFQSTILYQPYCQLKSVLFVFSSIYCIQFNCYWTELKSITPPPIKSVNLVRVCRISNARCTQRQCIIHLFPTAQLRLSTIVLLVLACQQAFYASACKIRKLFKLFSLVRNIDMNVIPNTLLEISKKSTESTQTPQCKKCSISAWLLI